MRRTSVNNKNYDQQPINIVNTQEWQDFVHELTLPEPVICFWTCMTHDMIDPDFDWDAYADAEPCLSDCAAFSLIAISSTGSGYMSDTEDMLHNIYE